VSGVLLAQHAESAVAALEVEVLMFATSSCFVLQRCLLTSVLQKQRGADVLQIIVVICLSWTLLFPPCGSTLDVTHLDNLIQQ
jgi:hypothetical protein